MSFHAHGTHVDVTTKELVFSASLLAASLGHAKQERIELDQVTGVTVAEPSATSFGYVELDGVDKRVLFAPNQDAAAFARAVEAALKGEAPAGGAGVTGLNFTAVDVETANDNWGSVCQIGAVRFRDGQEVESRTWLCTPRRALRNSPTSISPFMASRPRMSRMPNLCCGRGGAF